MKAWRRVREHWRGLLVIAALFTVIHVVPKGVLDGIGWALFGLVLVVFVGVPLFEWYAERRLRSRVRRHIEGLGYEFIEIKRWHEHFGVTFVANGKKHYVRFEHGGWGQTIDWVDGPPEHAVSQKS